MRPAIRQKKGQLIPPADYDRRRNHSFCNSYAYTSISANKIGLSDNKFNDNRSGWIEYVSTWDR